MTTEMLVDKDWTTICRCGADQVAVEPEAVIGRYAVHLAIHGLTPVGPGYTVTHRAAGLAVWHVRALDKALAVAKWLDENGQLPETAEAVQVWKQQLTSFARTRLVFQLTQIAPREYVVRP